MRDMTGGREVALELELRPERGYAQSHVTVEGHGVADTCDVELAAALAKYELERVW